jgi:hypothetical protein
MHDLQAYRVDNERSERRKPAGYPAERCDAYLHQATPTPRLGPLRLSTFGSANPNAQGSDAAILHSAHMSAARPDNRSTVADILASSQYAD